MFKSVSHNSQRSRKLGFLGILRRVWLLTTYLIQRCSYQWKVLRLRKNLWAPIDEQLVGVFLNDSIREQERYSELFSYLVSGLVYYRASDYAHIYYPGASSEHGAAIDAMEGFCRTLPMISAWISSGRPSVIKNINGKQIDLMNIAKAGLLAGTNPKAKGFWGHICDYDQRIVEAADIALSVWLLRGHLWPQLSSAEKERIIKWLLSINGKIIADNNWHLFPVMVNEVLSALGYPGNQELSLKHYYRLKSFYLGNGWFSDGPEGEVDYYNAWGIHYALFWINLINPKLDPFFIDSSLNDFVRNYKYLFSTDGFPITGRSICYRMAAPSPLIAAATRRMDGISPGMARRALDCMWRYFIKNGAVCHGKITQGYWQEDLRLLDNYSGPGSSLWSTRSLALAFYNPPYAAFWTAPLENMPIEEDDYKILIPEIQWEIRGYRITGEVQIIKMNTTGILHKEEKNLRVFNKFLISVLRLPYRSQNKYASSELKVYSSMRPFWLTESLNDHVGIEKETSLNA